MCKMKLDDYKNLTASIVINYPDDLGNCCKSLFWCMDCFDKIAGQAIVKEIEACGHKHQF